MNLAIRYIESHYLIPAFGRCGVCGGAMCAMSRSHGNQRAHFYGCMAHHKRGKAVCTNSTVVPMDRVDGAVLAAIGGKVLRPDLVEAVLAGVFDEPNNNGIVDARRLQITSRRR